MNIREWQKEAHTLAVEKGWWDGVDIRDPNVIAAKLALIHSEVSEALECVRDGEIDLRFVTDRFGNMKPEGLGTELADVVIRVLDLAGALGIGLQEVMAVKHEFNRTRKHRHGGRKL